MRALHSPTLVTALLVAGFAFVGAATAGQPVGAVAGPDVNGNGVRDDVDAWLSTKFTDQVQRAAARQVAKALQAAVSLNPPEAAAARAVSRRVTDAVRCVFIRFPMEAAINPTSVIRELEALTTNTLPRKLAYRAYNKTLDGSTATMPEGNTCE